MMPGEETAIASKLSSRELATVLAALRKWQRDGMADRLTASFRVGGEWSGFFYEDAPLTARQIDRLCERLNMGE